MDLNHVAVFVDDLEQTTLSTALGGWGGATIQISGQPVMVGGRPGEHSGRTRRVRTASHPPFGVSIEDVAPDAPIQPAPGHAWHHIAVWCADIPGTVRALEKQGYRRDVVGRGAGGELATFAYMISDDGPRLELADAAMKAPMLEYFARTTAAPGTGSVTGLSEPLTPYEITVVVETDDALDDLKQRWQTALGGDWGDVTEHRVSVRTAEGVQELRTREVSTLGAPRVTIVAPAASSRSLLAPVTTSGWHHVGFACGDLARDIQWFERAGFTTEFSDLGDDGQPRSFAMMTSPEGTKVKLVRKQSAEHRAQ